jgi:hypothetical protein
MSDLEVLYVVGKILTRATTLVETSSLSEVRARSYDLPKSQDYTRDNFGTPKLESRICATWM